jgi:hypothetical protein
MAREERGGEGGGRGRRKRVGRGIDLAAEKRVNA